MNSFSYTKTPSQSKNITFLKLTTFALIALWSLPAMGKPPGSDDDDVRKRGGKSFSGPTIQNHQPARIQQPTIQSPPTSARQSIATQPTFSRPPIASDGMKNIRSQNNPPPAVFNQSRSVNIPPTRSEAFRANVTTPTGPVFNQMRSGGNSINTTTPQIARQQITPQSQKFQPKVLTVAADDQKNQNKSTNNQNIQTQRQEIRQNIRTNIQENNPTIKSNPIITGPTNKTNQNLRLGGASDGAKITTTPKSTFTPPPPPSTGDKAKISDLGQRIKDQGQNNQIIGPNITNPTKKDNADGSAKIITNPRGATGNLSIGDNKVGTDKNIINKNSFPPQDIRSGNNPSMSEIRNRLIEQGRGKGIATKDFKTGNDNVGPSLPDANKNSSGSSTTLGPANTTTTGGSISDLKQTLGTGDKGGKRGSPDTNLNKNTDQIIGKTTDTNTGKKTDLNLDKGQDLNIGKKTDLNLDKKVGTDFLNKQKNKKQDLKLEKTPDLKLDKKPDFKTENKLQTPVMKHPIDGVDAGITTKQLPKFESKKISRDDMIKARFPDRLKSGELEKVTKGDIAQKVKLNEQFNLMKQGDVARRMDLYKHPIYTGGVNKNIHIDNIKQINNITVLNTVNDYYAFHPQYHHGPVHSHYVNNCFKFVYFGPSFFAGACWYPHWNPWVSWSWHYHSHPIWDPRPIWCRPIIYDPYYDWVYWQPPVWITLPVVQSGTWVEVQRPIIPEAQYDLQLLAVRFVDPGHPDEKLGPRYRVWFRNNSNQAIDRPFNVMLFGGNDDKLTADLPRSGVRVKAIEAGDTQSVDIRLPMEVAAMWRDADGKPAPFQVLHAMIDANREIKDITPANNGAIINRDEILSVDPVAFEVDPANVGVGSELVLAGEGLGPQPGQVVVNIAGKELQAEVLGWYDLGVRVNMPSIELNGPTPAEVLVVRGDGAATNPIKVTLMPGEAGPAIMPPVEKVEGGTSL